MSPFRTIHRVALVLAAIVLLATAANAATINGAVYQGYTCQSANLAAAGCGPLSNYPNYATFTTSAINYNSNLTNYTTGGFLQNPTFTSFGAFNPAGTANNIFVEFTGLTYLNAGANSFVVGHDDGVMLYMPGIQAAPIVNAPGPTGFNNTPFVVNAPSAGFYSFTLDYNECCGAPAILQFTVNGAPPLPEPGALAVLCPAILAVLFRFRRK